ncbi:putative bifunctional diguanylate cyclase/phosphodiesterase [Martelella radicis]|uniref:Diguanylate cyclase (GGDEF)-like protein n=1 Tax=Martelella radicis TaxID=1397476 RepID=A0A7W6KHW8_9HYPH|nr:EAL domain-containing protein [Martelella radicis]MBB4121397.1 diguanylate cyclase (GGDEF)-like protein [Martelella radicis]
MKKLKEALRGDIVIVLVLGLVATVFLVYFESFERLHTFSRAHEDWELDEFFTVLMVASFALLFLLVQRTRSLRREVTSRHEAERLAQALARQDTLTGISNRRYFEEECERRLTRARRKSDRFSLLFIDFDRFKQINDSLGHEAGDRLLQVVSDRLKKAVRPDDFLGRLGGDEFAVLMQDTGGEDTAERLASRLLTDVSRPVMLLGREISPSVSIGVASYPKDGTSRDTLLKKADAAMYRAKEEGRRRIVSFSDEMDGGSEAEQMLELDLAEALSSGQIIPYYQLISSCSVGEVVLVEVLARWKHPKLGVLSAGDFISHAEAAGLIPALFKAVLVQACKDARQWPSATAIAVNVTPHQLCDPGFAGCVLKILRENDFPPGRLELEVTKDALVVDLDATRQNIMRLKSEGIRVSLDDFGTGYSSLRQLRELPFDRIKIDRSFISGVGTDPQSDEIVASTIKLCRALGLKTVAEGIEDKAQLDWICAHGADAVQGYFNAMPVPADELAAVLKAYPDGRVRR